MQQVLRFKVNLQSHITFLVMPLKAVLLLANRGCCFMSSSDEELCDWSSLLWNNRTHQAKGQSQMYFSMLADTSCQRSTQVTLSSSALHINIERYISRNVAWMGWVWCSFKEHTLIKFSLHKENSTVKLLQRPKLNRNFFSVEKFQNHLNKQKQVSLKVVAARPLAVHLA